MTLPQPVQFTPAWPHSNIQKIFPNIFFVTGTNKIHHEGVDIQTSRNMTIIRHGSELTLINTVRLDEEGLRKLDLLGNVAHIVRIGEFHGRDDAFYRHQYPDAQLWTLKGMTYESSLKSDRELTPEGIMPFPDCTLFVFETSTFPEGILHIKREGGILISCDSIQNITSTDAFYSSETAQSFHNQGLVKPANISSIWLKATHTKAADFNSLLKNLNFQHLLTAHGEPLLNTAHEEVKKTVNRVFPK
ncbi:MAG: hypothetical protein ACRYGR_02280 [Janthinobacterium lividum]